MRALALLLVLVYHSWVLTGAYEIGFYPLQLLISLGGEIGVTAFFVLSGYGIYCSLDNKEQTYSVFLKKRIIRITPEYYIFLLFMLLFTQSAAYISKSGIKDILLHLFFIHNINPQTTGSINGVLWTMAVTVQYYIIAIPVYKCIKKHPFFTVIAGIGMTIIFKYICFHYLIKLYFSDQPFWYSRNIFFSVFDNFIIGMFVSCLCKSNKRLSNKKNIIGIISSVLFIFIILHYGVKCGIHTDNTSGYLWHSLIAIGIGGIVYFFNNIKTDYANIIMRSLLLLSRYEYGIYIIHLVMMLNLINNSEIIMILKEKSVFLVCFVLIVMAIVCGIFYNVIVDLFRKEITRNN